MLLASWTKRRNIWTFYEKKQKKIQNSFSNTNLEVADVSGEILWTTSSQFW